MTLIELILLVAYLACGLAIGDYVARRFGIGYGILAGIAGTVALPLLLGFLPDWLRQPLRPPVCRHGICRSRNDYEHVGLTRGADSVYQCRCGDRYVVTFREFWRVLPDGSCRLHAKRNLLGRWKLHNPKDQAA